MKKQAMAVPLIAAIGGLSTLVTGYFAVSAVSVLAHWISVAAALGIGAYTTYILVETDFYDLVSFDSDLFSVLSALPLGVLTGFVSFRLIESIFASVGGISAFAVVLVVVSALVFSPALVAEVIAGLISVLSELLAGDN